MTVISTEINISASPAAVRTKFLDFGSISSYHPDGFIKSIALKDGTKNLEPGVQLIVDLEIGKFEPVVLENSPDAFVWSGSLPGIFTGNHAFRFTEGADGSQSTTLIQEEHFSGLLSFTIGDNAAGRYLGIREKTQAGFKRFNEDLKKACEQK